MVEETMTFKMGQPIECIPPKEGYLPVLNGSSFDIIAFLANITRQEIDDWLKGEARIGLYIKKSIPIVLFDLGRSWSFDIYLNILQENEDVRESFLGSDNYHPKTILTLVSYSDSIVQGIRTIDIHFDLLLKIKEACFEQALKYPSKEACQKIALKLLSKYSADKLRAKSETTKQL